MVRPVLVVRKALPADAETLPAVERSAGEAFRGIDRLAWVADDDVQSIARHREMIEHGTAWVATLAGEPIGFLRAESVGANLHIWGLAVRHAQQGRGIGRALVETACAWAIDCQRSAITLTTFRQVPWNEPFYRSLGFVTLSGNEVTPFLACILAAEVDAGLPGNERCAMRRELR